MQNATADLQRQCDGSTVRIVDLESQIGREEYRTKQVPPNFLTHTWINWLTYTQLIGRWTIKSSQFKNIGVD